MGHEFHFEVIPVAEAMEQGQVAEQEEELPVVMVVDDEPLIADSLAAILGTAGLHVLKAYDGSSALELAIAQPPQLLVTDVAMPGMNGIDLAMAIAEAIPSCRVLLFSAHASSLDLGGARSAGFDFPLLSKPIHPREMLRRVNDSLQGQPARRRHPRRTLPEPARPHLWEPPALQLER